MDGVADLLPGHEDGKIFDFTEFCIGLDTAGSASDR
jgi:hypothetical protein